MNLKALAALAFIPTLATPALAGPYVETKSEFKGADEDFKGQVHQGGVGYDWKEGNWLLLHSDEKMSDRTEALLMVASRAQLTDKVILPLLIDGKWVVADRYADSTIAYQGGGRGLNPNELDQINYFGTYTLVPDLTFYLDLPVDIANKRMSVSRDRIEREGENFQQRVRDMYLSLCEKHQNRFVLLDGSLKKEEIHSKVCQIINERFLK